MSFSCFIPGGPVINASSFRQVDTNRWVVDLERESPVDEIAAFISQPLQSGVALGCHVSAAPFEKWHYLGALTNAAPSIVLKPRFVWSAEDATPTAIQFGVSLQSQASLSQTNAERVSAEVIETAKRIGHDMYTYISSFAEEVQSMDGPKLQVPAHVYETWLTRFIDKCSRHGLDWLRPLAS